MSTETSKLASREAMSRYLDLKSKGQAGAPGNYVALADYVLTDFLEFIEQRNGDAVTIDAITSEDVQMYAAYLRDRWSNGELKASSANTYYQVVSAFFSWCTRHDYRVDDPSENAAALEYIPDVDGEQGETLFWSDQDRSALLDFVQRRVEVVEGGDFTTLQIVKRYRDWAFVNLLAHTGLRIGEVCRSPHDGRREGLQWVDIDFDSKAIKILGKSQTIEQAPMPNAAVTPLNEYKSVLEPPRDDWPVFPTQMPATRGKCISTSLKQIGMNEDTISRKKADASSFELVREYDITLPATTTDGGRKILRRLCEQANIDVDVEGVNYLQPHGARRKLGDELYRSNPAKAQMALRHKSIETTRASYSHINAGEVASDIDEIRNEELQED